MHDVDIELAMTNPCGLFFTCEVIYTSITLAYDVVTIVWITMDLGQQTSNELEFKLALKA